MLSSLNSLLTIFKKNLPVILKHPDLLEAVIKQAQLLSSLHWIYPRD